MNIKQPQRTIWFVYDGDCPLCTQAALALRIKQHYGRLILVDARAEPQHLLMQEILLRKFDLDEGMVIYDGQHFYHGKTALTFMARFGEYRGWFNWLNKILFWSAPIASIGYPWLRGVRNCLLRQRGIGQIDNLDHKSSPIFKNIFAEDWHRLPTVMQQHYRNHPYCEEQHVVTGTVDVMCAAPLKWLSPLFWTLGMIPPANAKQVPVTVIFRSHANSKAFIFDRTFHFPNRKPYRFQSRMEQVDGNTVIERMRFGIGWKTCFKLEDKCVKLKHQGYVLHVLGHDIALPLTALIGAGNAIEIPVDDLTFDMRMEITHPWWGKMYGYQGRFYLKADH